jgi:RNA polymerase sigma-70 factor (ECF subfamily)
MRAANARGDLPVGDGEGDLVGLARAGDRQALGVLVERHYGALRALLLRYGCVSAGDVDDLVQETFLRSFRALARYEDRGHLRTWLFRIALNLARDARRRSGLVVTQADVKALADLPDSSADPVQLVLDRFDGAVLGAAVARLPESQREALVLRFYADLPLEEIARIAGCPEGTVKSRLHYALRKLRGLLLAAQVEETEGARREQQGDGQV